MFHRHHYQSRKSLTFKTAQRIKSAGFISSACTVDPLKPPMKAIGRTKAVTQQFLDHFLNKYKM